MSSLQEVESLWQKVCFDPSFQPEGRYQTYRELVFSGMIDVMENICPVAYSILSQDEWRHVFWEFLKKNPPKTVIIRKLPYEVSQYLKQGHHSLMDDYPYLGELMEYEYLEVDVRFAPEDLGHTPKGQVRLNPAFAIREYVWPVHFISQESHDKADLPMGQYFLLIWRNPTSLKVNFMELSPLVASLIDILQHQGSMERLHLLKSIAQKANLQVNEAYFNEGQALIDHLTQEQILFN